MANRHFSPEAVVHGLSKFSSPCLESSLLSSHLQGSRILINASVYQCVRIVRSMWAPHSKQSTAAATNAAPYRCHAATSGLAPGPPARLFCFFFCSRKQTMTVLSYFVWNCPTQRRNVGTSGSRCTCHNGVQFNPNCHELRKQEKCSSLAPPRRVFYKTQWAWQSVKITRLMSIFTSKKVWKFLIKNSADKIQSKNYKGG